MSVSTAHTLASHIEIIEPAPEHCSESALPPEGHVKQRNYRVISDTLRAYTPSGDVHTSPEKRKLVARFDVSSAVSPPRTRILELLRPDDPGRDALDAIVRPAPRRGLARPLDDDARRFLQRALLSPSPQLSNSNTPEPHRARTPNPTPAQHNQHLSLADELREAEEKERGEHSYSRSRLSPLPPLPSNEAIEARRAAERERLARLALAVEAADADAVAAGGALAAAAKRLDALLEESRGLHEELHGIHADLQMDSLRAVRCSAAARALGQESMALRYLDDIVALLKGDIKAAHRAKSWPFAIGPRQPDRSYIV